MKAIMTVAALFCALSVRAQAPNVDQDSQDQARRLKAEQKAAEAAAAAVVVDGDDEVTYEQVLRAPDDIKLSTRYAKAQIRKGDLRGAATTLERLTMLLPNDPSVRLLYAVVLYRLDDAANAEREIRAVLKMSGLPGGLRREAEEYLGLVESRRRDVHFDARLTFGVGYDDNRNAAPDGDVALAAGLPVLLNPTSRQKKDTNTQLIGSLGASRDFGGPKGHSLFGRLTVYRGDQRVYSLLDLQSISAKIGTTLRTRVAEFTPYFSYDYVLLNESPFLDSRNAGLRVERKLSRTVLAFADFSHSYQDFTRTPRIATAEQRTGDQLDASGGVSWAADPKNRFTATVAHRRKFAKVVSNAYRREAATLEWMRLYGRGIFTVATVAANYDRYELPDRGVSVASRHDDAYRGELLFGAPLSLVWKPLKAFTGTIGYERFQQYSTIRNFEYSNNKLTALVTYKWGI